MNMGSRCRVDTQNAIKSSETCQGYLKHTTPDTIDIPYSMDRQLLLKDLIIPDVARRHIINEHSRIFPNPNIHLKSLFREEMWRDIEKLIKETVAHFDSTWTTSVQTKKGKQERRSVNFFSRGLNTQRFS